MAYASKYYDPEKAHQYYLRTRQLTGYENRYGGSRGDGTSAASTPGYKSDYAQSVIGGSVSSGLSSKSVARLSKSSSSSSSSIQNGSTKELTKTQKHNQKIKNEIQKLRDSLSTMSKEDRKANKDRINDQIQSLRQQLKGGSTSGFNQKGIEAAMYIKDQMEKERDEVIKKTNKDCDKEMLSSVQRLAADIKAMRESGHGYSHKEFSARIKALLGETKKKKIKAKRKHISDYKQKYKDEIDKLRGDETMYTYHDKKNNQNNNSSSYYMRKL